MNRCQLQALFARGFSCGSLHRASLLSGEELTAQRPDVSELVQPKCDESVLPREILPRRRPSISVSATGRTTLISAMDTRAKRLSGVGGGASARRDDKRRDRPSGQIRQMRKPAPIGAYNVHVGSASPAQTRDHRMSEFVNTCPVMTSTPGCHRQLVDDLSIRPREQSLNNLLPNTRKRQVPTVG